MIDVLDILADGDAGVRLVGVVDYFEFFIDWDGRDGSGRSLGRRSTR